MLSSGLSGDRTGTMEAPALADKFIVTHDLANI